VQNAYYYFRRALTWSGIASETSVFRIIDAGSIHDSKGMSAFSFHRISREVLAGYCNTTIIAPLAEILNPTPSFQIGDFNRLPILTDAIASISDEVTAHVLQLIDQARTDWDGFERSWLFERFPLLDTNTSLEDAYNTWCEHNRNTIAEAQHLEEESNRLFIDAYGLSEELSPAVPLEKITLTINPAYRYKGLGTEANTWQRFQRDTMAELISYAIGCMMGRYSLDCPGLVYAGSQGKDFDSSLYTRFAADDDGIVPITNIPWFEDDAAERLEQFIVTAWDSKHLEENLMFVANSLYPGKSATPRNTLRRYLVSGTGFYKDHLAYYQNRPIYWLFSSGRRRTFQCLVYLHRYQESTLARIRTAYAIPLQGKMASRISQLKRDIEAATGVRRRNLSKEHANLLKDQEELLMFDNKLRYYADQRISLDLDDGVRINYGKFGDLLANAKKVTGSKPKTWK